MSFIENQQDNISQHNENAAQLQTVICDGAQITNDETALNDEVPTCNEVQVPVLVRRKRFFNTTGYQAALFEYNEQPDLIEGKLPKGEVAVLAATSDIGKSMLASQIVASIAMEKEEVCWHKLNLTYKRAAYLSSEDGLTAIGARIRKWNLSKEELRSLDNLHISADFETIDWQKFADEAEETLFDLIVIDVLTDFITGDLNNALHVRQFMKNFKKLAAKFGTSILFLHHIGKASERSGPSKVSLLGSSAIESSSRCVWNMTADSNDDYIRYLTITKGNRYSVAQKKCR